MKMDEIIARIRFLLVSASLKCINLPYLHSRKSWQLVVSDGLASSVFQQQQE